MKKLTLLLSIVALAFQACETQKTTTETPVARDYFAIEQSDFGTLVSGDSVKLYTLKSPTGMEISIMNYGAVITSWLTPDQNGKYEDVVIGFDNISDYVKYPSYYGAVVGRYGNRIAKGQFSIDGESYQLAINNDPNNLHGGVKGFDKVLWNVEEFLTDSTAGLVMSYWSKDMEEGFPGNLQAMVRYALDGNDALTIEYFATTDKATHVNLTQHSYFNLSGDVSRDILGHELMIDSDAITPVDQTLIPTGELMSVAGTPFDFNQPTVIGARINDDHEQITFGLGYDHNWVLDSAGFGDNGMTLAAVLTDSISGRKMEVLTEEPGIQFYSGNFMTKETIGKDGKVYDYRYGLCLETQHFPDTPNQPDFPSTLLQPGEQYMTKTIYRFSTMK